MEPIALDAMGGDYAPEEIVKGAVAAASEGIPVALVGREGEVAPILKRLGYHGSLLSVVHAPQVISPHEPPLRALRQNPHCSIAVGIEMVKERRASAFLSAGPTGAVVAASTLILGKASGVERPALGLLYNTRQGAALMLDVGANADCRPSFLLQFAYLGNLYMERVLGIPHPRIGILSNGEEDGKGNYLVRQSFALLKNSPLNFIGNLEAKDLFLGQAQVIVTDGFSGNLVLKAHEGMGENLFWQLAQILNQRPQYKLLGLLLRPVLKSFKKMADYSEYGGAPLLGVAGNVIAAHGRSRARAIHSALRLAHRTAQQGLAGILCEGEKWQNLSS